MSAPNNPPYLGSSGSEIADHFAMGENSLNPEDHGVSMTPVNLGDVQCMEELPTLMQSAAREYVWSESVRGLEEPLAQTAIHTPTSNESQPSSLAAHSYAPLTATPPILVSNQHHKIPPNSAIFSQESRLPLPRNGLIYLTDSCRINEVQTSESSVILSSFDSDLVPRTPCGKLRIAIKKTGPLYDPFGLVQEGFEKERDALMTLKATGHRHFSTMLFSFSEQVVCSDITMTLNAIAMPYMPFNLNEVLEMEDDAQRTGPFNYERAMENKRQLRAMRTKALLNVYHAMGCLVHTICFIHHGIQERLSPCRKLLHHDLKPSNILLDADLHIQLTDFELSTVKRGQDITNTTQHQSTPVYEPPEKANDPQVGAAYDIWGLGCVLLLMVTWIQCETTREDMSSTTLFRHYRQRLCRGNHHFKDCHKAIKSWIRWLKQPTTEAPCVWLEDYPDIICLKLREERPCPQDIVLPLLIMIESMLAHDPELRPSARQAKHQLDLMGFPIQQCCEKPFRHKPMPKLCETLNSTSNCGSGRRFGCAGTDHLEVPSCRGSRRLSSASHFSASSSPSAASTSKAAEGISFHVPAASHRHRKRRHQSCDESSDESSDENTNDRVSQSIKRVRTGFPPCKNAEREDRSRHNSKRRQSWGRESPRSYQSDSDSTTTTESNQSFCCNSQDSPNFRTAERML